MRPAQFDVLPTLDGYEVIDVRSGRPVDRTADLGRAREKAQHLNWAAEGGRRSLCYALGAREPGKRPQRSEAGKPPEKPPKRP